MQRQLLQKVTIKGPTAPEVPQRVVKEYNLMLGSQCRLILACQHHKVILPYEHFKKVCMTRDNGKECKYCQGYFQEEVEELKMLGYKIGFRRRRLPGFFRPIL